MKKQERKIKVRSKLYYTESPSLVQLSRQACVVVLYPLLLIDGYKEDGEAGSLDNQDTPIT